LTDFCGFSAIGSVFFGDQKEIFQVSLHLLLFGPSYVPTRLHFDLSVLVSRLERLKIFSFITVSPTDTRPPQQPRSVQREESAEHHAVDGSRRGIRQGEPAGDQVAGGVFLQVRGQGEVSRSLAGNPRESLKSSFPLLRMIKKMTDEILENPKDRDSKQKSQDEAVNARK
jgi:hypothetical protein